ncbi:MAG TPA: hypothetical protein VGE98_13405, partial [Thermoanaerobaculia bacterium]
LLMRLHRTHEDECKRVVASPSPREGGKGNEGLRGDRGTKRNQPPACTVRRRPTCRSRIA